VGVPDINHRKGCTKSDSGYARVSALKKLYRQYDVGLRAFRTWVVLTEKLSGRLLILFDVIQVYGSD